MKRIKIIYFLLPCFLVGCNSKSKEGIGEYQIQNIAFLDFTENHSKVINANSVNPFFLFSLSEKSEDEVHIIGGVKDFNNIENPYAFYLRDDIYLNSTYLLSDNEYLIVNYEYEKDFDFSSLSWLEIDKNDFRYLTYNDSSSLVKELNITIKNLEKMTYKLMDKNNLLVATFTFAGNIEQNKIVIMLEYLGEVCFNQ